MSISFAGGTHRDRGKASRRVEGIETRGSRLPTSTNSNHEIPIENPCTGPCITSVPSQVRVPALLYVYFSERYESTEIRSAGTFA